MAAPSSLATQISNHLASRSLFPTQLWLLNFLSTQKATTPIPALKQTALFRLLASDIIQSLQSTSGTLFPSDITNAEIIERRITGPVPVQVLSVEDIGRSRWGQVEDIEAAERGETTKGREVVRVVPGEEGLSDPTGDSSGPHKLTVQDAKGTTAYAFEMATVQGLGLNMNIGLKLLLTNVTAARGVLLLEPSCVVILGGKIDNLHKTWKDGRKDSLKVAVGSVRDE